MEYTMTLPKITCPCASRFVGTGWLVPRKCAIFCARGKCNRQSAARDVSSSSWRRSNHFDHWRQWLQLSADPVRPSRKSTYVEDEHLLVLNKPGGHQSAIRSRYPIEWCSCLLAPKQQQPYVVHRLDKRNQRCRFYSQILWCCPRSNVGKQTDFPPLSSHCRANYARSNDRQKSVVTVRSSQANHWPRNGQSAVTHVTIAHTQQKTTDVYCVLDTGTHQIRVHLASIGHPVVGDPLYQNKPAPRFAAWLWIASGASLYQRTVSDHPQPGL